MGKIWVEVCLISARGLRRSSSLWKLQWFAVGWIDLNSKYCTKIDASSNENPVWRTKFATSVDDSSSDFHDLALHVQVYSREPLFLTERLQGSATIVLREFLAKHGGGSQSPRRGSSEQVGSYQLRRKNSNKPQGFVDVAIRVYEERTEAISSFPDYSNPVITLETEDGPAQISPSLAPLTPPPPFRKAEDQVPINFTHGRPVPDEGPSYTRPPARTPPPPLPPTNVGYVPTLLPRAGDQSHRTYINLPSSAGVAQPGVSRAPPGFVAGVGAGALAAGAVIFGDDFMSGFDVPSTFQDASLTVSTDPLF